MNRFRKLLRDLDLLIGVALAVTVAILGVRGSVSASILSSATLVVLALVVTVFFRMREQLAGVEAGAQRHSEELAALSKLIAKKPLAGDVFRFEYPDLSEAITSSTEIWVIAGASLRTTVGTYFRQFQSVVSGGAFVRLVCPDPSNEALMTQAAQSQGDTMSDMAANIGGQLTLAKRLVSASTTCEIRVAPFLPTLGIVKIIRPDSPPALYVKLLPFSYVSGAAPVVALSMHDDRELFDICDSVVMRTWEASKPLL